MPTELIPLLAAVSAALIAGYFSFVTLVNSKEQKTSEFRQNWIDSLRSDIGELTSSVYFIRFYYQQGAKNTDPEFINGIRDIHCKYVASCAAILLRVNAKEKEGRKLKEINDAFLGALSNVQNAINAAMYDDAATQCGILLDKAKPLLKEEWKRVKAGELSYRIIKYFSIAMFGAAVLSATYIVITSSPGFAKSTAPSVEGSVISKSDKTNNSQNCTLSVALEPAKQVKRVSVKEPKCGDSNEKSH